MSKRDNIIYIVLIIISAFLMISRFMIYIIGILLLFFLLYSRRYRNSGNEKIYTLFIALFIVTCFEFVHVFGGVLFSSQEAIKEIQRVIIYFLIVKIVSSLRLDVDSYIRIWRFFLYVIVGIAFLQFTKIIDIDSYLISIYGFSVQFYNSAQTSLSLFRAGSIFINPNVLATFLVAYLSCYLILKDDSLETRINRVFTYVTIAIGLVLAGSRAGLVIGIAEVIFYYYLVSKQSNDNFLSGAIFRIFTFACAGFILYLFISSIGGIDLGELRLLQVGEGRSNSLEQKFDNFKYVMSNGDFLNYLFGFGPFDYSKDSRLLIDFEFGYFIAYYGLLGIGLYIGLVRSLLNFRIYRTNETTTSDSLQRNRNRNILFTIMFILFGLSSGVFFNLRLFSVLLTMFTVSVSLRGDFQDEEVYSL